MREWQWKVTANSGREVELQPQRWLWLRGGAGLRRRQQQSLVGVVAPSRVGRVTVQRERLPQRPRLELCWAQLCWAQLCWAHQLLWQEAYKRRRPKPPLAQPPLDGGVQRRRREQTELAGGVQWLQHQQVRVSGEPVVGMVQHGQRCEERRTTSATGHSCRCCASRCCCAMDTSIPGSSAPRGGGGGWSRR